MSLMPDRGPRVNKNRSFRAKPIWYWVDKPDPDIRLGPGTRIESRSDGERGTVECAAHPKWRIVRWDDDPDGSVGVREYVRLTRIRAIT